jgi:pimeloyl-ACP methyl ester carboxylesterase
MTEQRFISDDGVRLVYDDLGEGPTIVLCHGLAAAAEQFADDAEYFRTLGFRVLVPDLRGAGRSGTPWELVPANFSVPRLARDLLAMLDHAQVDKVHWVGNSLGGIAALEMLPAKRFLSLATFGTAYSLHLPRVGGHNLIGAAYAVLGKNIVSDLTAAMTSSDPAARALITRVLQKANPKVTAVLANVLTRYDLIDNALETDVPILLLRGGKDSAVNRALAPTLDAMTGEPHFTLKELPDGGHCANLDATAAFREELLAFWGGVGKAKPAASGYGE